MTTAPQAIAAALTNRGLASQAAQASALGISRVHWNKYVRGHQSPGADKIAGWASANGLQLMHRAGAGWRAIPDPRPARIITLNMGLGRDSIAMLCLLIEGKLVAEGNPINADAVSAVVFSDLGVEWQHTYQQIPKVRAMCEAHGIRMLILAKPSRADAAVDHALRDDVRATGVKARFKPSWFKPWAWDKAWKTWGARSWGSIEGKSEAGGYHLRSDIISDFSSRSTIASRRGDCTDNHKIQPIRKLVRDLCWERFDVSAEQWSKRVRAGTHSPHLTLIGIAADEASRAENGGNGPAFITEAYPLIEMGITKEGEQDILKRHGFGDVRKSGCSMCPFQPVSWFWALRETDPQGWSAAVDYESKALAKNPKMFVTGTRTLPDHVNRWRARHPEAALDAVLDKSYGRCGKPTAA